ncbi:hypothetical protein H072_9975 [Dactylellina haptotyla CBS 200.50]|uniref:Threonine/serine exporter-like N-terminal domain-containing protein n=1 Tax=Dactylellina haptotyla (strain CBS 200.50) TaxID=1284197 RepID=S8BBG1_DACHA|nr:hypothetical protein H072_9975 [Dactylellina haptotyla CBS 200.50]
MSSSSKEGYNPPTVDISEDRQTPPQSTGWQCEQKNAQRSPPRVHFESNEEKFSRVENGPREKQNSLQSSLETEGSVGPNQSSQRNKLDLVASLEMAQRAMPLLAANSPYIKKEEFDEEAAPVNMSIENIDPQARTVVQQLTRKFVKPNGIKEASNVANNGDQVGSSGLKTPIIDDYRDIPAAYKPGVLASLLKLAQQPTSHVPAVLRTRSQPSSAPESPQPESGTATPSRWYKTTHLSTASLLAGTTAQLANAYAGPRSGDMHSIPPKRPRHARTQSGGLVNVLGRFTRTENDEEIKLRYHIAHTLQKQRYLLQLCRALMLYGAPTHRLEEYLKMSARVLDIEGQFLYMPGCMIISFDDSSTHTSNMQLVRVTQALDLGKLQDVHLVYKQVVHDIISVEEARLIDLPICFLLGSILGTLALVIAPRSTLYSNVFEIVACVVICFIARAFGSIKGGSVFCFAGIAQASIALILPGYIVLCGALELQSKNLVAGSVRMFYALIYSLLLGFGITIGTALYGAIDPNATSSKICPNIMSEYYKFLFVLIFTLCLNVLNQCKWKQLPMSLFISAAGFAVNFFATRRFPSNVQVANALGAFAIGVIGNLYSRVSHQIAFTSIVPAIFIQVPSGLAAQGGLISGLDSADSLTNKTVTASVEALQSQFNSTIANVALGMIQFGKRRSGLFTF